MKGGSIAYRPRIDGLRAAAITFVLVEHFGGSMATLVAGGYYGVDLFFVISGYLITSILLNDKHPSFLHSWRVFLGRRALRIFPPYYLLLLVLFVTGFGPIRWMIGSLLTYTFNYPAARWEHAGKENPLFYLWSLSVEEQFYVAWPPIVLALRNHRRVLFALVALIVVTGYAQSTHNIFPALQAYNYTGLINRMGSLGLGAMGAVYTSRRALPAPVFDSAIIEWMMLSLLLAALTLRFRYRYVLMGVCSLYMVLKAAQFHFRVRPLEWLLTHRKVVWVGSISYGIYLFHVPLSALLTERVFDPFWNAIPFDSFGVFAKLRWNAWLLKFPLYTAASIGVAAASYRWFESPILSLKSRWFS